MHLRCHLCKPKYKLRLFLESIVKNDTPKDDFLDAPDLGLDLEPPKSEPTLKEPSRGGAFLLPGSEDKPKKKVINYKVKKNDTLWNIAKDQLGSAKQSNISKIMKIMV